MHPVQKVSLEPMMGHSIHNVDISKPLTHTMPYTLSAICPVQWKPGFIREENTSPKCQTPSNVSICPLKSVTTNCSQVETPMRTTSMQMSFPETVSDSLCRKSLVMQKTGLRRSWRWRCWMWRSWAGVVTRGLRLWGRLDVQPKKNNNLHNMSLAELYFILSGKNEINSAQKRERRMTAYFLILISYLI